MGGGWPIRLLLCRKDLLDTQSVFMLTWAYNAVGHYNKDLFVACCDAAVQRLRMFDTGVNAFLPLLSCFP